MNRMGATSISSRSLSGSVGRAVRHSRATAPQRALPKTHASILPEAITKVRPHNDLVFVKVGNEEIKTAGGIYLPNQSQKKPTSGVVIGVGNATTQVKEGDVLLYGKWGLGVTDIDVQGVAHVLMKESDAIGIMPTEDASVDDLPQMKPTGDRVLVKVDMTEDTTKGGVLLPESAKDKPISGVVVAVGPGKKDEEMKLSAGDKVMYFKYAGDKMMTSDGTEYVTLHQQDILCRMP